MSFIIASATQIPKEPKQSFASLVSVFGQHSHLVYQIGIFENDKKSEIHVVQELLRVLQVNKAVFSLDALHCQTQTVEAIVNSGNGYIATVKKNQPGLYHEIEDKSHEKPEDSYFWKQTGHGHDTRCRIRVFKANEKLKKMEGIE
jgi:predicted transposase YbfD/YdcC